MLDTDAPQPFSRRALQSNQRFRLALLTLLASFFLISIILNAVMIARLGGASSSPPSPPSPPPPPPAPCPPYKAAYETMYDAFPEPPPPSPPPPPLKFVNCQLQQADGSFAPSSSSSSPLLVENGRIVASAGAPQAGAITVDCKGRWLSAGLVDMHSHLGVYSWPDASATADGNEMTAPFTPFVRAADGLNAADPAIAHVLAGGVTAAQILPGSGNVCGGQALLIKLRADARDAARLAVRTDATLLKCACGENPKRVYGDAGQAPMTRMGETYLWRAHLREAAATRDAQDACTAPQPQSLEQQPFVDLLRGRARLNVHCYKTQDLTTMLRVAREFNFSIAAFHHAHEAPLVADALAAAHVTVAMFADLAFYKLEAWRASRRAAARLEAAGVDVAFVSDHGVLDARHLLFEAQKAAAYGMSPAAAMRAVTSAPAAALGHAGRLGCARVGCDADVVLWSAHPIRDNGARPLAVFVDGALRVGDLSELNALAPIPPPPPPPPSPPPPTTCVNSSSGAYAVLADDGAYVVVDASGVIACVGAGCAPPLLVVVGARVTAGLIAASTSLALVDVDAETSAQAGAVESSDAPADIDAVDGVRVGVTNRAADAAYTAGVLSALAIPQLSYARVQRGRSGLVSLARAASHGAAAVLASPLAVHVTLGAGATAHAVPSQVAQLKRLAANASLPLALHVDDADTIATAAAHLAALNHPYFIIGGAEAHLVASSLALATSPCRGVVLTQAARCKPDVWSRLRCDDRAPTLLKQAGVRVVLGAYDPALVASLRFEAGYAVDGALFTAQDALDAVTSNVADMLGVPALVGRIAVGMPARLALWSGDPFAFQSTLLATFVGSTIECAPTQPEYSW